MDDPSETIDPVVYLVWGPEGPIASLAPIQGGSFQPAHALGPGEGGLPLDLDGVHDAYSLYPHDVAILSVANGPDQLSETGLYLLAILADGIRQTADDGRTCADGAVGCTASSRVGTSEPIVDAPGVVGPDLDGDADRELSSAAAPTNAPVTTTGSLVGQVPHRVNDADAIEVAATAASVVLAPLVLFTLYSRLRPSTVLKSATRRELLHVVRDRPGVTYQDLAHAVDTHISTVRYHVSVLEEHGMVTQTGRGRRVEVYPSGHLSGPEKRLVPLLRSSKVREIVRVVTSEPGIRQADIARRVDRSDSTVAFHVSRLEEAGGVKIRYTDPPSAKRVEPSEHLQEVLTRGSWERSVESPEVAPAPADAST